MQNLSSMSTPLKVARVVCSQDNRNLSFYMDVAPPEYPSEKEEETRKTNHNMFKVQNPHTQHEKTHNLLLSRTNNSQQCDLTQADLTQNILTNPVQIQDLAKWWEHIQTKVWQPAGSSQGYPPESMTVTFSAMNNPQNSPTLNVVQAGTGCEQSNGGIKAG